MPEGIPIKNKVANKRPTSEQIVPIHRMEVIGLASTPPEALERICEEISHSGTGSQVSVTYEFRMHGLRWELVVSADDEGALNG